MNKVLLGALATLGAGVAIAAAVVYSGAVDVAADSPHSPLVYRLIETAREHAIAHSIRGLAVPSDLGTEPRVRRGAGNYAAMCQGCHLSPGTKDSEIRVGLYPQPPDLTRPSIGEAEEDAGPETARRFWIIKHGIKASGMAAWSKGGMEDEAIWDLVAFLGRLPGLSPDQYHDLVAASPGHHHGGLGDSGHEADSPGHRHNHTDDHDHDGH